MLAYVSTAWWSLIGKMDFARMFFRQLHFALTCYYSIIVFDDMSTLLLLLTVYILGGVSSRKSLLLVTDVLPGPTLSFHSPAIACIQKSCDPNSSCTPRPFTHACFSGLPRLDFFRNIAIRTYDNIYIFLVLILGYVVLYLLYNDVHLVYSSV